MFNGKIHQLLVKDTKLVSIQKSYYWDVESQVEGNKIKMMFDFNPAKPKELIDKQLCLAIVNPDVHRVNF